MLAILLSGFSLLVCVSSLDLALGVLISHLKIENRRFSSPGNHHAKNVPLANRNLFLGILQFHLWEDHKLDWEIKETE